jgi:uncharacterized membrane protein YqjE
VLSRISRTIPPLLAHLGAYSRLVAHDVEAALHLLRRLIGAVLLLLCLGTALVISTAGVMIAAAWVTSYRWAVTAAVIAVLLCGCLLAFRLARSSVARLSSSFDRLRTELQVDAALLKQRFGTSISRVVVEESTT